MTEASPANAAREVAATATEDATTMATRVMPRLRGGVWEREVRITFGPYCLSFASNLRSSNRSPRRISTTLPWPGAGTAAATEGGTGAAATRTAGRRGGGATTTTSRGFVLLSVMSVEAFMPCVMTAWLSVQLRS